MNGPVISALLFFLVAASQAATSSTETRALDRFYSDGEVATTATRKLAASQNLRYLKPINTKDLLFEATTKSGEIFYAAPGESLFESIDDHQSESMSAKVRGGDPRIVQ